MVIKNTYDHMNRDPFDDEIVNLCDENGNCPPGCADCCSNTLPLTDKEIKVIAKYIKEHRLKPIKRNYPSNLIGDCTCPLLDEKNRCRIYHIRPRICRIFKCNKPLTLEEQQGGKKPTARVVFMRKMFFE